MHWFGIEQYVESTVLRDQSVGHFLDGPADKLHNSKFCRYPFAIV